MGDLNIWPGQTQQGWYLPHTGNTWKTNVLEAEQQLPLNLRDVNADLREPSIAPFLQENLDGKTGRNKGKQGR